MRLDVGSVFLLSGLLACVTAPEHWQRLEIGDHVDSPSDDEVCPAHCRITEAVMVCEEASGLDMQQVARCINLLGSVSVVEFRSRSDMCTCSLLDYIRLTTSARVLTFTPLPCGQFLLANCESMLPDPDLSLAHNGLVAGLIAQADDKGWRKATKAHLSWVWRKVSDLVPRSARKKYRALVVDIVKSVYWSKSGLRAGNHDRILPVMVNKDGHLFPLYREKSSGWLPVSKFSPSEKEEDTDDSGARWISLNGYRTSHGRTDYKENLSSELPSATMETSLAKTTGEMATGEKTQEALKITSGLSPNVIKTITIQEQMKGGSEKKEENITEKAEVGNASQEQELTNTSGIRKEEPKFEKKDEMSLLDNKRLMFLLAITCFIVGISIVGIIAQMCRRGPALEESTKEAESGAEGKVEKGKKGSLKEKYEPKEIERRMSQPYSKWTPDDYQLARELDEDKGVHQTVPPEKEAEYKEQTKSMPPTSTAHTSGGQTATQVNVFDIVDETRKADADQMDAKTLAEEEEKYKEARRASIAKRRGTMYHKGPLPMEEEEESPKKEPESTVTPAARAPPAATTPQPTIAMEKKVEPDLFDMKFEIKDAPSTDVATHAEPSETKTGAEGEKGTEEERDTRKKKEKKKKKKKKGAAGKGQEDAEKGSAKKSEDGVKSESEPTTQHDDKPKETAETSGKAEGKGATEQAAVEESVDSKKVEKKDIKDESKEQEKSKGKEKAEGKKKKSRKRKKKGGKSGEGGEEKKKKREKEHSGHKKGKRKERKKKSEGGAKEDGGEGKGKEEGGDDTKEEGGKKKKKKKKVRHVEGHKAKEHGEKKKVSDEEGGKEKPEEKSKEEGGGEKGESQEKKTESEREEESSKRKGSKRKSKKRKSSKEKSSKGKKSKEVKEEEGGGEKGESQEKKTESEREEESSERKGSKRKSSKRKSSKRKKSKEEEGGGEKGESQEKKTESEREEESSEGKGSKGKSSKRKSSKEKSSKGKKSKEKSSKKKGARGKSSKKKGAREKSSKKKGAERRSGKGKGSKGKGSRGRVSRSSSLNRSSSASSRNNSFSSREPIQSSSCSEQRTRSTDDFFKPLISLFSAWPVEGYKPRSVSRQPSKSSTRSSLCRDYSSESTDEDPDSEQSGELTYGRSGSGGSIQVDKLASPEGFVPCHPSPTHCSLHADPPACLSWSYLHQCSPSVETALGPKRIHRCSVYDKPQQQDRALSLGEGDVTGDGARYWEDEKTWTAGHPAGSSCQSGEGSTETGLGVKRHGPDQRRHCGDSNGGKNRFTFHSQDWSHPPVKHICLGLHGEPSQEHIRSTVHEVGDCGRVRSNRGGEATSQSSVYLQNKCTRYQMSLAAVRHGMNVMKPSSLPGNTGIVLRTPSRDEGPDAEQCDVRPSKRLDSQDRPRGASAVTSPTTHYRDQGSQCREVASPAQSREYGGVARKVGDRSSSKGARGSRTQGPRQQLDLSPLPSAGRTALLSTRNNTDNTQNLFSFIMDAQGNSNDRDTEQSLFTLTPQSSPELGHCIPKLKSTSSSQFSPPPFQDANGTA